MSVPMMEALRRAIDEDEALVLETHPQLGMFLRSQATFVGEFSDYRDPTFVQYATLVNSAKSLELFFRVLFQPKPSDPVVEFQDVFLPTESNTKVNLLVLAVHCENFRTDTLRFLLDYMREHREHFPHITADEAGPYRPTALFEAVELRHVDAIQMLLERGADPLVRSNGLPPPLLALTILHPSPVFDSIWERLSPQVQNAFISAKWDEASLEMKEDGLPLRHLLLNRGHSEMAKRIGDIDRQPIEPNVIPAPSPLQPPDVLHSEEYETTQCSEGDCDQDEALVRCEDCGRSFCQLHIGGHICHADTT
jgi:hypothetical protein